MFIDVMPKFLTITETRRQLLNLPDQLADEPVIITRHGKPAMVALGYEQFESLMETLEVLSDPDLMVRLRQSITQADSGETIALEDAISRLGL
jgi:antitoxin YefM